MTSRRMPTRPHIFAAFAAAFVVMLAACGGSDSVSTTSDSATTVSVDQVAEAPADGQLDETGEPTPTAESVDSTDPAESASAASPAAPAEPTLPPEEAAAANQPLLQRSDDARDIEVLSVVDGSISTLRDAVEGDRPILLWFWAPH